MTIRWAIAGNADETLRRVLESLPGCAESDASDACVVYLHAPPRQDAEVWLLDRMIPPGGCLIVSEGADVAVSQLLAAGADEVAESLSAEALLHALKRAQARACLRHGRLPERTCTQILDSLEVGLGVAELVHDADGKPRDFRWIATNPAFDRQAARKLEVGRPLREQVPDIDPMWLEAYARVVATGTAAHFEHYDHAFGRCYEVFASRVGLPKHPLVAVAFLDVTARVNAERALRENEANARAERALLDAILTAAPVGIIVADANGQLIRENEANRALWGPTPPTHSVEEFAMWKGWWANGAPHSGQPVAPDEWAMARALRGETSPHDIVRIRQFGPDGGERYMLNSGAPVRDPSGRVIGGVIAQMDITERMHVEAALKESEERFRTLADNISQLAWMADETGSVFWYNHRWYEYTGTTFEQMAGWGWRAVHDPAHLRRVEAKFREAIASGTPWEDTFPLRRHDGVFRAHLSRAMPVRDAHGRVVRWLGTNTDVEEQQRQAAALAEAVRVRDTFLQVAAHELRTPLTALILQLQGLDRMLGRDARSEPGRIAEKVAAAARQSDRLAHLVDDLLSVARLSTGRVGLHRERLDLTALVRDTTTRMADVAARAGCPLSLSLQGPIEGSWDAARLEQVVTNLLFNAVKYAPGKPIEITLEATEGDACLRVRDHGIGIAPADQGRIFERFERAVSPDHYGGLGLGLYISREIVQAHGGMIQVESVPGEGATFSVHLPRTEPA